MNFRAFIAALLISNLAFGFGRTGQSTTSVTQQNVNEKATAAVNLYVDPTGTDSDSCVSSGTAACLTIQRAWNNAVNFYNNSAYAVTINVAAGTTYAAPILSGWNCMNGGSMLIQGALAASTNLATGSATGTATGNSVGSNNTYSTLTDSGATWTTNDLAGRFITNNSVTRVIRSNTGTVITVVGGGTFTNTAYTISDNNVTINSVATVTQPQDTSLGSGQATSGLWVFDNVCSHALTGPIAIKNIKIAVPEGTGGSINIQGPNQWVTLDQVQVVPTSGSTVTTVHLKAGSKLATVDTAFMLGAVTTPYGIGTPTTLGGPGYQFSTLDMSRSMMVSTSGTFAVAIPGTFSSVYFKGWTKGLGAPPSGASYATNIQIDCNSVSSSYGIYWAYLGGLNAIPAYPSLLVSNGDISNCTTAVYASYGGQVYLSNVTGTSNTTALNPIVGGIIGISSNSTITGTTEITVDSNNDTIANMRAYNGKFIVSPHGSRVSE